MIECDDSKAAYNTLSRDGGDNVNIEGIRKHRTRQGKGREKEEGR